MKQTWRAVASQHTRYDLDFDREVLIRNYQSPEVFIHSNLATCGCCAAPSDVSCAAQGKGAATAVANLLGSGRMLSTANDEMHIYIDRKT